QGNFLDDETIEKVKEGMTREQVRFVLGDPVLEDSFSKDSWEYIYYLRVGRKQLTYKERLTVYFEDDKVSKLTRHESEKPDV
ncbi:MAG: outer membrane protein assembly factor BamE, partial [Pseudomonadota bacterium]